MLHHSSSTLQTVFSNIIGEIVPGYTPSLNKRVTQTLTNTVSKPMPHPVAKQTNREDYLHTIVEQGAAFDQLGIHVMFMLSM